MPSSVVFQGGRKFRPGVYGESKLAPTTNQAIASGAVALLGDFPLFKKDEVMTFVTAEDLLSVSGGEYQLDLISHFGFSPRADLSGSPSSISIVNVRPSTQASTTLGGLKIKARHYGLCGNRVAVELFENDNDADLFDLHIYENGIKKEANLGIGKGKVASIEYTDALLDDVKLTVDQATDLLKLSFIKNVAQSIVIPGTSVVLDLPVQGGLTFTQRQLATPSAVAITIHGLSEAGSEITTTLTLPAGAVGTTISTQQEYSQITSIVLDGASDYVGSIEIGGTLYSQALSEISSLGSALLSVGQIQSGMEVNLPESIITGTYLDNMSGVSIKGAPQYFTCNVAYLKDFLDGSMICEGEIVSGASVVPTLTLTALKGGSVGDITTGSWQSALQALLYKDINIVCAYTDEISVHKLVQQHCIDAAIEAGLERNAWVGTAPSLTVQQIYAQYSKELNDRNMAVVGQTPVVMYEGEKKVLTPKFLAFMMACFQASLGVATPLTRKQPRVFATLSNFVAEKEASSAIQKGIVLLTGQDRALRVERSVTTWLKDNNPFYSEVSTNESVNLSIRDLRQYLDSEIGSKATLSQKDNVLRLVQNRLSFQRDNGLILDFKDVSVRLAGDVLSVAYAMAAIEPLNFILITANVGRL
jgi:hypothetical protein